MPELLPGAAAAVDWLGLGVIPDEVERMLAGEEAERFVARLARPVRERAFRGAGLGAIAAMSDSEAARLVAQAIRAKHPAALEAFRRLAFCHRLVSGKRADALALVEDALVHLTKKGRLPPIAEHAPPAAGGVSLRDRHVVIALDLLEREPARLALYPLLDRACRVSYRAYALEFHEAFGSAKAVSRTERRALGASVQAFEGPGGRIAGEAPGARGESNAVGKPGTVAERIAGLTVERVKETLERALGPAPSLDVEEVVAIEPWLFVFLRERGAARVVDTGDGGVLAPGVERHILKFDLDGRLEVNGGAIAVRIAEALLSGDGSVRYQPHQPESDAGSVREWLLRLVDGRLPQVAAERAVLSFSTFEAEVRGDVGAGVRTLSQSGEAAGSAPQGDWVESVKEVGISFALPSGAVFRCTLWLARGGDGGTVSVTYRAASAGLRERRAFEREAEQWGIAVSPR